MNQPNQPQQYQQPQNTNTAGHPQPQAATQAGFFPEPQAGTQAAQPVNAGQPAQPVQQQAAMPQPHAEPKEQPYTPYENLGGTQPPPVQQPQQQAAPPQPAYNSNESALSAAPAIDFEADAGDGLDDYTSKDKNLPNLILLQSNSSILTNPEQQRPGAEIGAIWSTHNDKIYPAFCSQTKRNEGLLAIVCAYLHNYYEYEVDEFGKKLRLVEIHPITSTVFMNTQKRDIKDEKGRAKTIRVLANGNMVEERGYHFFMVPDSTEPLGAYPTILKYTGRKLSAMKNFNTEISKKMMLNAKGGAFRPPVYASIWRITSCMDKEEEWVNLRFEFYDWVKDLAIYEAAKQYRSTVIAGEAKVDYEDKGAASAAEADDGSDDGVPF